MARLPSLKKKADGAGIGPLALSLLSLVVIVLLMPIVMGGTIALTIALAGEDFNHQTPDDFNSGVDYLDPFYNCDTLQNPAGPSTSSVTLDSVNWTTVARPTCAANAGSVPMGAGTLGRIIVKFPAGVLSSDATLTRFAVEVTSPVYCNTAATCEAGWIFDWAVKINGTEVFGVDDATSVQRRKITVSNAINYHSYFGINFSLIAFDEIALREEMALCGANSTSGGSCNATLIIDDFRHKDAASSNTAVPFLHGNGARWRFITYDTRADTASLVLRASAWGLGFGLMAMAVAATPAWTPTLTFTRRQVAGGRGATYSLPGKRGGRIQ